jgi:hypothetical protein
MLASLGPGIVPKSWRGSQRKADARHRLESFAAAAKQDLLWRSLFFESAQLGS